MESRKSPQEAVLLTERQAKVYEFVRSYILKNFRSPTLREISTHFGFASPSAAAKCHVDALAKKGLLVVDHGRARGIGLADPPKLVEPRLPLLPGPSSDLEEADPYVDLSELFDEGNHIERDSTGSLVVKNASGSWICSIIMV